MQAIAGELVASTDPADGAVELIVAGRPRSLNVHTTGGLRLGSIGGIEIHADWSLLIIFALITFGLATGLFPSWHPNWSPATAWITALVAAVLFLGSILVHELSHALVGRAHGVQIRRITLFMFGGVAEMENEPPSWWGELSMAIVGPLTSLALGFAFLALASLGNRPVRIDASHLQRSLSGLGPAASLLLWLGPINVMLGVFNLVPGFPLDGGRVLRAVMWGLTGDLHRATQRASRAGQFFAWLLMSAGLAMMLGLHLPVFGAGFVNGLWLAFIGWYLNNAALLSYRQLLIRESLEHIPVSRLMQTRFLRIDPQMRLGTLVNEHLMGSGQRAFPVEANGRLVGIVSLRDLQKCARDALERTSVAEIMTPAARLVTLAPVQDAMKALELMGGHDLNQIPVMENGAVVGLIRREDILTWLSMHAGGERSRTEGTWSG
jgi:Zn-dependent protease/CBS domain-containing protein